MFNCKMIINRLHIEDARMEIGVAINCPFDVDVSSPKARILFECDGQTRRLPLRVVNYFRQKQEGSCIVVCNYTYLLDQIFYRFQPESPVTVTIDFEYGRHTVQALPFTVSTNVLHETRVWNCRRNTWSTSALTAQRYLTRRTMSMSPRRKPETAPTPSTLTAKTAPFSFSRKKEKRRSALCAAQPCAGAPVAFY